jgi:hypothetical protein
LPNAHDDLSLRYQRSWKEHRGAQRKTGGCINGKSTALPSGISEIRRALPLHALR